MCIALKPFQIFHYPSKYLLFIISHIAIHCSKYEYNAKALLIYVLKTSHIFLFFCKRIKKSISILWLFKVHTKQKPGNESIFLFSSVHLHSFNAKQVNEQIVSVYSVLFLQHDTQLFAKPIKFK